MKLTQYRNTFYSSILFFCAIALSLIAKIFESQATIIIIKKSSDNHVLLRYSHCTNYLSWAFALYGLFFMIRCFKLERNLFMFLIILLICYIMLQLMQV